MADKKTLVAGDGWSTPKSIPWSEALSLVDANAAKVQFRDGANRTIVEIDNTSPEWGIFFGALRVGLKPSNSGWRSKTSRPSCSRFTICSKVWRRLPLPLRRPGRVRRQRPAARLDR